MYVVVNRVLQCHIVLNSNIIMQSDIQCIQCISVLVPQRAYNFSISLTIKYHPFPNRLWIDCCHPSETIYVLHVCLEWHKWLQIVIQRVNHFCEKNFKTLLIYQSIVILPSFLCTSLFLYTNLRQNAVFFLLKVNQQKHVNSKNQVNKLLVQKHTKRWQLHFCCILYF